MSVMVAARVNVAVVVTLWISGRRSGGGGDEAESGQ